MTKPDNPNRFSMSDFNITMRYMKFLAIGENHEIITQGDDGDRFYVILKGELDVKKAFLKHVPTNADIVNEDACGDNVAVINWLLCLLKNYDQVFWKKIPYSAIIKNLLQRVSFECEIQSKLNIKGLDSVDDAE